MTFDNFPGDAHSSQSARPTAMNCLFLRQIDQHAMQQTNERDAGFQHIFHATI